MPRTLSQLLDTRENGLTQLRLILAFFVLIDHAYALNGYEHPKLLWMPLTLSSLAVRMFIFLSGLLVLRSAWRHNIYRYFKLRAARLMPGYWACLLVTCVLIMPAFFLMGFATSTHWHQLLHDSAEHLFRNALLFQWAYVPAGWLSGFPVPALNGSLWTLQPEWMAYVVILALAPLFLRSVPFSVFTFIAFDLIAAWQPRLFMRVLQVFLGPYGFHVMQRSHLYLAVFLLAGMLFMRLSPWILLDRRIACLAFGLLLVLPLVSRFLFTLLSPLLIPYVIIVMSSSFSWPWRADAPDLSYGVYLYSFPIQQLIIGFDLLTSQALPILIQILIASGVALPIALLSWRLVERPALSWAAKPMLAKA